MMCRSYSLAKIKLSSKKKEKWNLSVTDDDAFSISRSAIVNKPRVPRFSNSNLTENAFLVHIFP